MAVVVVDIERQFPLHRVPVAVTMIDHWVLTSLTSAAEEYLHPSTRFVVGFYGGEGQEERERRIDLIRKAKEQAKGVIVASTESIDTIAERLGLQQGVDYDAHHQKPYRMDLLTTITTKLKYAE